MANAAASNDPNRYIGQVLGGRYRVERLLGHGGMGAVFQGTHTTIGGKCAIKVLSANCSANEELRHRFVDEAIAPNKLEHDGVIKVHDVGETDDGSLFLAMEFLDGEDLEQRLFRTGAMSWDQAATIVRQLCNTLAVAHAANIVHRDMKPANCFLVPRSDGGETVKILDFGIAKLETDRNTMLTTPGSVMGTPYYMPPEQARGAKVDHRADIYAVGAILYELLEGHAPYEGDSFAEVLIKVVTSPFPPPTGAMSRVSVPDDLCSLLERVLAKDPDQRYPTMAAFAEAIDRISHRITSAQTGGAEFALKQTSSPAGPHAHGSRGAANDALSSLSDALARATSEVAASGAHELDALMAPIDESGPMSLPQATDPGRAPSPFMPRAANAGTMTREAAPVDISSSNVFAPPQFQDTKLELDRGVSAATIGDDAKDRRGGGHAKLVVAGSLGGMTIVGLLFAAFMMGEGSGPAADANTGAFDPTIPDRLKPVHWSEQRLRDEGSASEAWRSSPTPEVSHELVAACKTDADGCGTVHQVAEIAYHGYFGIPVDLELAAELYTVACMHGAHAACHDAGYLYERGLGLAADGEQARRYFAKGCQNNDPNACTELGEIYTRGRGVARDAKRAEEYYWQGCKDGSGAACLVMAELMERGKAGTADDVTAADYYRRACDTGEVTGCVRLADMYDESRGVDPDPTKARQLRLAACEAGHAGACKHIASEANDADRAAGADKGGSRDAASDSARRRKHRK